MKTILASVLLISAAFLAGCTVTPQKLINLQQTADELGIDELQIPGRVTNTKYTRQVRAGRVRATLEHNNPWLTSPAILKINRPVRADDPAEEPAK